MTSSRDRSTLLFFLVAAIALSAVVSLLSVRRRAEVESGNRTVGIAVELDVAEPLALSEGLTVDAGLVRLREAGVTHLAITEETVSTLIAEGRLTFAAIPDGTILRFTDADDAERVRRAIAVRYPGGALGSTGKEVAIEELSPILVRQLPIGLPPEDVRRAKRARLGIVARGGNPAGLSERTLRATLAGFRAAGADSFLPSGDQVIGRRDLLPLTSTLLREEKLRYLSPEFAKIGGDSDTVERDPGNAIRLHTAQAAELDKIGPAGAVERFVRAAKERNQRMLLLRPVSGAANAPLGAFATFVADVRKGLAESGLRAGRPSPYRDPALPSLFFPLLGALGTIVCGLVLGGLTRHRGVRAAGWSLLGLLTVAGLTKTGQQAIALLASGAFPVAGFLIVDRSRLGHKSPAPVAAIGGYLVISAVSVAGGLFVAGLLNGLPYLVKADEFRGIKISVFVPVLVVGAYFLTRLTDVRGALDGPIRWRTAAIGVFLVALVGVMLSRTGNDGPVGASGGELALRGGLEKLLSVRPRTKEFLVGHPALLAGLALLAARFRRGRREDALAPWTVLLLALGAVGQTSVVNTLCHLHIPVALSLSRIVLGLALGAIVGAPIAILAARFAKPSPEATDA